MTSATPERPWLGWYVQKRWLKRVELQRHEHPLCKMCLEQGIVMPMNVADHVIPHKGDPMKFWFGELQSLCFQHHNRSKQQLETRGYVNDIGNDGWPIDANHPVRKLEK